MLKRCLAMMLFMTLLAPLSAQARAVVRQLNGIEWLQSSGSERMDAVRLSLAYLKKEGLRPQQKLNDYYNGVYTALRSNHSYYEKSVTDILAAVLYEKEPENRPVLDRFRQG